MKCTAHHSRRAGLTLAELLVATGLAAIVMLAVLRLVDAATNLWTKGERRRALIEQAGTTAEMMARDLRALHSGSTGDLLIDWYPHDVEQDGITERVWPRLRFVRSATSVDLARFETRARADQARALRAAEENNPLGPLELDELYGSPDDESVVGQDVELSRSGLMEVAWCVVPGAQKGEGRYLGYLLRAERLVEPGGAPVVLAPDFFDRAGRPPIESVEEITGGLLWLDVLLATQTTTLDATLPEGGWSYGDDLTEATRCWDAWRLARPDPDVHVWNEPSAGMSPSTDVPLLPRRVRLELEIERPVDLQRRPRLLQPLEEDEVRVQVSSTRELEQYVGRHVLVGGEWLRVRSVSRGSFSAERAQRGTARRRVPSGALVHFGEPLIVEVPVPLHRDDWTLSGEEGER